ncbi:MAG: LPS export ABC transporter periplasmic protein LptC [Flavobacteriales bacterium]|nr:LPS export ABC transporter periplasmic protein LptC [Flavobacteriales bacterium]
MLFACSSDLGKIKEIQFTADELYPVETLQNAKLIYSDSAIVRVILNATQMDRYVGDESYLEITKGLKVHFYNPSGSKESELTSQYAKIDEEKNLMEAKNTVKVKNVNGDLLETEHLVWNEKTEMVYTEEFVKITTKDEVIYGEGLESNQDFTKYTIKKISGTIMLTHADE